MRQQSVNPVQIKEDDIQDVADLTKHLGDLAQQIEELKDGMSEDEFKKMSREMRNLTRDASKFSDTIPKLERQYKSLSEAAVAASDMTQIATKRREELQAALQKSPADLSIGAALKEALADEAAAAAVTEAVMKKKRQAQMDYTRSVADSGQAFINLRQRTFAATQGMTPALARAQANTGLLGRAFGTLGEKVLLSIPIIGTFMKVLKIIGPHGALAISIFVEAFRRFKDLEDQAKEFRQTTGLLVSQMERLVKPIRLINVELASLGVTLKEIYTAAADLYDSFQTVHLVTENDIKTLAQWSANIGIGSKDAAKIKSLFTSISNSIGISVDDAMLFGAALAKAGGVAPSQVIKDIAEASENMLIFMAKSPIEMMKATVEARRMGTTIKSVADSAKGFLNYSDSITSELSASALIGKSLNFQLARSLAYEGKIVESRKEALRVVKSAGDFTKLNAYQQQELAKAANMTVEEIIKQQNQEKILAALKRSGNKEDIEAAERWEKATKAANAGQVKSLIDQGREMAKNMDRQGKIDQLTNHLKGVYIDLTDALADIAIELWPEVKRQVDGIVQILKKFTQEVRENKETIRAITKLFGFIISLLGSVIKNFLRPLGDVVKLTSDFILSIEMLANEVGWFSDALDDMARGLDKILGITSAMVIPAATFGQHVKVASLSTKAMLMPAAMIADRFSSTAKAADKLRTATSAISNSTTTIASNVGKVSTKMSELNKVATAYKNTTLATSKLFSPIIDAFKSINTAASGFKMYMLESAKYTEKIGRYISYVVNVAANSGKAFGPIFKILQGLGDYVKYVGSNVGGVLVKAFSMVTKVIGSIGPGLTAVFQTVKQFSWVAKIAAFFGKWLTPIGWIITGIELIVNIFKRFKESMGEMKGAGFWESIWIGIKAVGLAIFDTITSPFVAAWKAISGWFGQSPSELGLLIVNGIFSVGKMMFEMLTNPFTSAFNFIKDSVMSLGSSVFGFLITPFKNAWEWVSKNIPFVGKLFGAAKDAAKTMANAVSGTIEAEAKTLVEVKNLDELKATIDRLTEAITRLNTGANLTGTAAAANNGSTALVQKLDELINLLKEGSIGVNIDGIKASKILARAST